MWQALSALGSMIGATGSIGNFVLQSQQNDWQKNMQQEAWDRENNAIQRRVADLKAAGLSPVLAAGQGASSSNPISIMAPQIDTSPIADATQKLSQAAQAELSLSQQKAQIAQTEAQTAAIKQQQDKTALEMAFMASNNPLQLKLAQQQFDFNNAFQPQQIQKAIYENKGLAFSQANAILDNKLKSIQVSQADQNLINSHLDEVSKAMGLTEQEKTIAQKQIAIDLAQNQLENARYDTDWYHGRGMPYKFNFGPIGPLIAADSAIGARLNQGIDNLKNFSKEVDNMAFKRRSLRKSFRGKRTFRKSKTRRLKSYGVSRGGIRL